jgi:aminoglycoside phosphotransferase (APT) family kinase protein
MTDSLLQPDEPSPDALRWVTEAVSRRATISRVAPLAGATSSNLYRVEVKDGGRVVKLALRQFVNAEWNEREPDLALREATNLRKASAARVATPELIAFDETGERCGVPSTLMRLLPGRVELQPSNLERWLFQLAEAILPIHELAADDYAWSYYPYADIARLEIPSWSHAPELWGRAIEIVQGPRPAVRERFIHRDYHPNNVLWEAGRVSGVIDWVQGCRGPLGVDVAWCRQNLAQLYGVAEADIFLDAYSRLAGAGFDYHPFWDLICAIEFLPGPLGVYEGWTAFGMEFLTDADIYTRTHEYIASVLARF